MAHLELKIGPLTARVTAADDKGSVVLSNFAAARGYEGSNQQRLQAVADDLARYLTETARAHVANVAADEAQQAVLADRDNEFSD